MYSTECIIIFCSAQFYLGGLSPPSPNDAPPLREFKISEVYFPRNAITAKTVHVMQSFYAIFTEKQFM